MRTPTTFRFFGRPATLAVAVIFAALLILPGQISKAASWSTIEPLKSRRADVKRALGRPLQDQQGETGTLRFKVAGGTVTVAFVTARFVTAHKLAPELEGTVLQVILQHDHATDTPESLKLLKNSSFQKEDKQGVTVFRNLKDGIAYTFINGKLKTSRYSPSAEQFARAQVKG